MVKPHRLSEAPILVLLLASCLINAQPLPAHRLPLLAAQGHDLADDWSLPSAHKIKITYSRSARA